MFADGKPLGPRGMYWLKVHLANFAGKDKMTFDDRAAFVDNNIDNVRQSATDPFGGDRWWMSLEDPFQGLATCIEITNAMDSGDPESYVCHLAVHMDGSCNGLQHYAALGRVCTSKRVVASAISLLASLHLTLFSINLRIWLVVKLSICALRMNHKTCMLV